MKPDLQTPCPGENTVIALLGDELDRHGRERLHSHIDRCATCRRLLAHLAREDFATTALGKRLRFARGTEPAAVARGVRTVGRFGLLEKVGEGGMGVVYAAWDPVLERQIAVKMLRADAARGYALTPAQLAAEARAMARVTHPNVVAVHDVGCEGGEVFIAMEWVGGGTLRQYLERERPGWERTVDLFVQAASGLAAAHAAGLVHRDFKPDNVLIDRDGRARVADFGLARLGRTSPTAGAVEETETAGTPAYMSPEQYAGERTDHRTDQFSFCVALWEALFRDRPFSAKSREALAYRVCSGEREPMPARPRVGRWVRRALERGLSVDPGERFGSMDELVAALTPPRRRLRFLLAAAAFATLAGSVTFAAASDARRTESCQSIAEREFDSAWGAKRRAEVERALLAERGGLAHWREVSSLLDEQARAWTAMRAQVCKSSRARARSTEMIELREQCLGAHRQDVEVVVGMLAAPGPDAAGEVVGAVGALPAVERCGDLEVVEGRTPSPRDPEVRRRVDQLRRDLVRADALRLAGRFSEAEALLLELRARSEAIGFEPAQADILYYLGVLQSATASDPSVPEATLERAAHLATASRYDRLAAEAWIVLIDVAAQEMADLDKAHAFARLARSSLDRIGHTTEIEARYQHHMGTLALIDSDPSAALAHYEEAVRIHRQLGLEDQAYESLDAVALVYEEQGRMTDALDLYQQVISYTRERFGDDHPEIARLLNNLASVYNNLGEHERALGLLERSLEIRRAAYGDEHLETQTTLHNTAEVLYHLGRYEQALERVYESRESMSAVHGDDSIHVAASLSTEAGILLEQQKYDEALQNMQRVLAVCSEALGPDSLETGRARINVADTLRRLGRHRDALEHDREAARIFERAVGDDGLYMPYANLGMGLDELGLGREARAARLLERAVTSFEDSGDPTELARARFGLARALWTTDRARAADLVQQAEDGVGDNVGPGATLHREIVAWRRQRGAR